jgi:outer membrane receptor for ferric coprogen and ferric-rhodotorulic acid
MSYRRSFRILALSGAAVWFMGSMAHADEAADAGQIVVRGEKGDTVASGATGLALKVINTPQSVSVVDRSFLDDFALDETNQLLRYVTGVNVEQVETERTYYNARGFDITDAMIDGIALPNIWGPTIGAVDSVTWDSVEVVRGANGLLTGTGNPSGTINYHRKHPTGERHMRAELSAGSWDKVRAEVDLDLPLTADGRWAVRLTGAAQDAGSYLRGYHSSRTVAQGVLDGQITDNLRLSAGYTRQDGKARGVMWGALPLIDSAGNQLDYDSSTSTTQDWTRWNTLDQTAYGELAWDFAPGWTAKANVTRKQHSETSKLFYVYGTPDAETGDGLYGYPGAYSPDARGWIYDGNMTGHYRLFGRDQQLTLGVQRTVGTFRYLSYPAPSTDAAWGMVPGLPSSWTGGETAEPAFGAAVLSEHTEDRQWRVRGATDLSITEGLGFVLGANFVNVKTRGVSFGASTDKAERALSPFVGVRLKVRPGVNLYASYSDIFAPQTSLGQDLKPLGSAKGTSWEAGVKAETADKALFGSIALFQSRQSNLAEYAGYDVGTGQSLYKGIDVRSRGVEAEVGGKLADSLTVQAGFTHMVLDDGHGTAVRTYVPRNTATLALRWRPIKPLQLGAAVKWQGDISTDTGAGVVRQGDYATLQLQAGYDLNDHMSVSLNVANATGHKYLTSLYWTQAYYAAPRSVTGSLRWSF